MDTRSETHGVNSPSLDNQAGMEDALAHAHFDLRQKMEAVHWVRGHEAYEKARAEFVQAKAKATAIYSKVKAQRARLAALETA